MKLIIDSNDLRLILQKVYDFKLYDTNIDTNLSFTDYKENILYELKEHSKKYTILENR